MLHETIRSRYEKQRKTYGRILRTLFGLTGVFWIVLYLVPGLDTGTVLTLRGGQTTVYFVLLSVWGLDYLREERRLRAVIKASVRMRVSADEVTMADVDAKPSLFTMIVPPKGTELSLMNVVFGVGLIAGATLMVLQYVRVVSALM